MGRVIFEEEPCCRSATTRLFFENHPPQHTLMHMHKLVDHLRKDTEICSSPGNHACDSDGCFPSTSKERRRSTRRGVLSSVGIFEDLLLQQIHTYTRHIR